MFRNFDKKTELDKQRKITYKKYFAFICKIENPTTFCWTNLMKDIISGDDMAQTLVRNHKTSLLYSIFKNKYNILTTIQSALKITEDIETRILKTENTHQELKDKITLILKVHKKDMQKFYRTQISFIHSKSVPSTNYWIYLNDTAKSSIQSQSSWISQLSLPVFTQRLYSTKYKSLSLWLANQYHNFDISKIKSYHYNKKSSNSDIYKSPKKYHKRPYNKTYNKPYNKTYNKSFHPKSNLSANDNTRNMFQYTNEILKKLIPGKNISWNTNYCGFWNVPQLKCIRQNCKKKHKCPICDSGEHKIGQCTNENIKLFKAKLNF